ncbi:MAG: PKD domain-containing protein [bacterium]|nr:PKD domain-containing protein [bacterium]
MIHGYAERRPQWTTMMGSGLVLAGLALFMVVFFTLFPILTNPVNAYNNWFPEEERPTAPLVAASADQTDPIARFGWEAIVVEALEPPVYRVRLQSTSVDGSAAIDQWQWDFGDSSGDRGDRVVHDYSEYGAYVVTLTVVDTDGRADTVSGEIAVPGLASAEGGVGLVNEFLDIDIDSSIQDAVGSVGAEIRSSIDGAVGSIGASARGAVVVFLFIMAAIATTIVAWRVARIGVMILNGAPVQPPKPPPSPDYDDIDRARQLEVV